ncbi:MAG TPA: Crp/Fnr family transcriptional regulator, partial [Dehalococcoidia bacterium]|nr:Crp/Fnr family transcriptional regulator [Dehalococcoidia bacterium]HLE82361.1 Crp/Fnr family transcriptional regulator [Dehalococcoidia bacterium]
MQQPTSDVATLLAGIPLFADLAPEELQSLGRRARRQVFQTDETIFYQDDPGQSLYCVTSGIVRIVLSSKEGREAVLVLLRPGEFFGELSLFDGQPRSASAIAMGPTEVAILRRDDFLSFLQEHPQAALTVLAVLSRRLRRTDDLIGDAVFLDLPVRIAKKLLELAETFGEQVEQGVEIAIRLRHQDLANMVGGNRESVSRYLASLEGQGLIRVEKQRITLLRPQALQRQSQY